MKQQIEELIKEAEERIEHHELNKYESLGLPSKIIDTFTLCCKSESEHWLSRLKEMVR